MLNEEKMNDNNQENIPDLTDPEIALIFYLDFVDKNLELVAKNIEELFQEGFTAQENWELIIYLLLPLTDDLTKKILTLIQFPKQNYLEHLFLWYGKTETMRVHHLSLVFNYLFKKNISFSKDYTIHFQGGIERFRPILEEALGEEYATTINNNVVFRLQYCIADNIDFSDVEIDLENPKTVLDYKCLAYYATLTENDEQKAIQYWKCACKIEPQNPENWNELIRCCNYFKKYDDAIVCIDKALKIPNNFDYKKNLADVYYNKGIIYRDIGDYLNANKEFTKAVDLVPNEPYIYIHRGWSFFSLNEFQKAEYDFEKAIELSNNAVPYLNSVSFYSQVKKFDKAFETLSRAILLFPFDWEVYNGLGIYYLELENYLEANNYFKKALEIDDSNESIYINISILLSRKEDWDGVVNILNDAIAFMPSGNLFFHKAQCYLYGFRNYSQALENIETAIELDPTNSYQLLLRGKVRLALEDFEGALKDYNSFFELNSANGILENEKVDVYYFSFRGSKSYFKNESN